MSFKIIFTWWNRQTFGTFLKTLFLGKYVGTDEFGNKYYRSSLRLTPGFLGYYNDDNFVVTNFMGQTH